MMLSTKAILLVSLHIAISTIIATAINSVQVNPYMDEIFHVPQAQQYCGHNFTHWDPMITTLPGLYLLSFLLIKPLMLIGVTMETACSVVSLRAHNIIFAVVNFILNDMIMLKLSSTKEISNGGNDKILLSAFVLSLFPVSYFFTFLYYTDQGSLCCVLLSYWLSLSGRHVYSALVFVIAVIFRQTNIVWLLFTAGAVLLREIEEPWKQITGSQLIMLPLFLLSYISGLYPYPRGRLFTKLLPYVIVAILFILFVLYNGSIVVGDKSHHQAVLHFPQLFYFFSFTAFFAAPHILLQERGWGWLKRDYIIKMGVLAVLILAALCSVHWFMYVHAYLLADNRHYPFYLWKDLLGRHPVIPYCLTPILGIAVFLCMACLSMKMTSPWLLLFMICIAMATVPQKLIEFRYFIIPYMMIRLHIGSGNRLQLLLELIIYTVINIATVFLFLYRPFKWNNSSEWQRFIWYVHAYLLADNRHYPFYLWKDLLGRHPVIPYCLTPILGIAVFLCMACLSMKMTSPWLLLFMICIAMATVPQKLIEFRYFIIPYMMIRLHIGSGNRLQLLLELIIYTVINIATMFLFLYHPFKWNNSSEWQRFIW